MRYIIVSKNEKDGKIGNDSGSLNIYFELGWEMVTTYFLSKRLYKENKIFDDDIIVTQKDRMFLYESIFKNVISYEQFKNRNNNEPVIDLVSFASYSDYRYFKKYYSENNDENRKYLYFEEDRDVNINFKKIDTSNLHNNKKYVCVAIRKRDHDNYRNMTDEWTFDIISELKKHVDKIFIVGKSTEYFQTDDKVKHVNLQEFASLCNDELCIANIGSLSGIMFIPAIFSKAKYNAIIDFTGKNELKTGYMYGNPLLMAKCIRYSNSKFIEFSNIDEPKKIVEKIIF